MSERLWFVIDTVIDEVEKEIRELEDRLETLIFHYEIAVVKEAAIRLASDRQDRELVDVKALKRDIHQTRNQIATKKSTQEDLSRLKEETVKNPPYREELLERFNAVKSSRH